MYYLIAILSVTTGGQVLCYIPETESAKGHRVLSFLELETNPYHASAVLRVVTVICKTTFI